MKKKITLLAALFSLLVSSVSAQSYLSVTINSYDTYVGEDEDLEVEATVKNESAETLSNVQAWVKINGNEWGGSTVKVGELAAGESKKVKLTAKEIYFGSGTDGLDDMSEFPSTDDDETVPTSFKLQVAASQYGQQEVLSETVTVEYIVTSSGGDDDDSPYEVSIGFNMIKLNIPSKVQVGQTITVDYSIATTYTAEGLTIHNAVVTLLANGEEVAKSDAADIPQGYPHRNALSFTPTQPGEVELTLVLTYDEIGQDKAGVHELTYGSKVTVEGEATAITAVGKAVDAAAAYNLHGQRVTPSTKGLVISGGRKAVVK